MHLLPLQPWFPDFVPSLGTFCGNVLQCCNMVRNFCGNVLYFCPKAWDKNKMIKETNGRSFAYTAYTRFSLHTPGSNADVHRAFQG